MYCNSVSKSYDPENVISKIFNLSPESNSGITLNFDPNGIFNNPYTPFFLQVKTLPQDLVLKISRVLIISHVPNVLAYVSATIPRSSSPSA